MKVKLLLIMTIAAMSVSCKTLSLAKTKEISSEHREKYKELMQLVTKNKHEIERFLNTYGVVQIEEVNMKQSGRIEGSINGEINGSGNLGIAGNVPALIDGLGGLAAGAASFPVALDLAPVSSLLKGLSGMGFGSMGVSGNVNGEIHGTFEGEGKKINDKASLFVVTVKDDYLFSDDNAKNWDPSFLSAKELRRVNRPKNVEQLKKIKSSQYIISESTLNIFKGRVKSLHEQIRELELMNASNALEPEVNSIISQIGPIKEWLMSKRVAFVHIGSGERFGKVETEVTKKKRYTMSINQKGYYQKPLNLSLFAAYESSYENQKVKNRGYWNFYDLMNVTNLQYYGKREDWRNALYSKLNTQIQMDRGYKEPVNIIPETLEISVEYDTFLPFADFILDKGNSIDFLIQKRIITITAEDEYDIDVSNNLGDINDPSRLISETIYLMN